MNTQIIKVGGHEITNTGKAYESMLTETGGLVSPRLFIAQSCGLKVTRDEKRHIFIEGKAEQTMKDVRALIEAKHGVDQGKALVKAANATYDAGRSEFYTDSSKAALLVAGDATLRKVSKVVYNKDGKYMGWNISARVERKASAAGNLTAKVADLEVKLAAALTALGQKTLGTVA